MRLEWGGEGVAALGGLCAVLVVVDVLSFSTSVDIAVGRGASVRPVRWADREQAASYPSWSLRPSSLVDLPRGTELDLASPNGATLSALAAGTGSHVLVGCLRNAGAVARAARTLAAGGPIGVIAAGERWGVDVNSPGTAYLGPLRPAVEDQLGAGAVVAGLLGYGSASVEAALAADLYSRSSVVDVLHGCVSGRELITAGHAGDVELAAAVDVSAAVPRLVDGLLRS
ncbi:hypothetical protein GCM10022243_60040 [Saccharothrix violaceirubra]